MWASFEILVIISNWCIQFIFFLCIRCVVPKLFLLSLFKFFCHALFVLRWFAFIYLICEDIALALNCFLNPVFFLFIQPIASSSCF